MDERSERDDVEMSEAASAMGRERAGRGGGRGAALNEGGDSRYALSSACFCRSHSSARRLPDCLPGFPPLCPIPSLDVNCPENRVLFKDKDAGFKDATRTACVLPSLAAHPESGPPFRHLLQDEEAADGVQRLYLHCLNGYYTALFISPKPHSPYPIPHALNPGTLNLQRHLPPYSSPALLLRPPTGQPRASLFTYLPVLCCIVLPR